MTGPVIWPPPGDGKAALDALAGCLGVIAAAFATPEGAAAVAALPARSQWAVREMLSAAADLAGEPGRFAERLAHGAPGTTAAAGAVRASPILYRVRRLSSAVADEFDWLLEKARDAADAMHRAEGAVQSGRATVAAGGRVLSLSSEPPAPPRRAAGRLRPAGDIRGHLVRLLFASPDDPGDGPGAAA